MRTAKAPKKQPLKDWHKADIKAALEKAGWSLSRLSRAAGYKDRSSLKNALHKPWPLAEHVIAHAIGVEPWVIWPSRYTNQQPNRGKPAQLHIKLHSIKARLVSNDLDTRAAG